MTKATRNPQQENFQAAQNGTQIKHDFLWIFLVDYNF